MTGKTSKATTEKPRVDRIERSDEGRSAVNLRMQQMIAAVGLIKALGGGWDVSQVPSPRKPVIEG